MRIRFLSSLLAVALLALPATVGAAGTPAGTVITNQATASAVSSDPATPLLQAVSNDVALTISPVCAPGVTPDGTPGAPGQFRTILPGEAATVAYTLRNMGNAPHTYALGGVTDPGAAFVPGRVQVYADPGNGQLAPGASPLGSVRLNPDEAVGLLLAVQSGPADRGAAAVALVAACGPADGGASDGNNFARVTVAEPPEVVLTKTFAPALVRPGDVSTVTLSVENTGQGTSREVVVTDPLGTPELAGAALVPGSVSAQGGVAEYSGDGVTYAPAPGAAVAAVRLRVPSLAPGARASLTFGLRAPAAEPLTLRNRASAASPGIPDVRAEALLEVRYRPGVALGPLGQPTAPEGSAQDTQTRDFAVVGQQVCFDQTLQNVGDVADTYTVAGQFAAGAAGLTLLDAGGAELAQPLALDAGGRLNFQACLTPGQGGALDLRLTATGARGTTNATRDLVGRVEAALPELTKTVDPAGQVTAGQLLTYTLGVRNPYPQALTGVVVRDALAPGLSFVGASDGGRLSGGAVVWTLPSLAPGATLRVTVQARVADSARDGDSLPNTFTLQSDLLGTPLASPTVQSPVWSAALAVTKSVSPQEATVGDRLTYTVRVRNLSPGGALERLTVTDTLPAGLVYLPGSARLGGVAVPDPQISGPVLTWTLGALGPQGEAALSYDTRLTPAAASPLVNVVEVRGQGLNNVAVASNRASAGLRLRPGPFSTLGDVVGVVFVDRNGDGRYQPGLDTPLPRARVALAGGRLALTDAAGRYHFAGVPEGFTALRLDPASVPYAPLPAPQDGGRPGSRGLNVRGLVSADFPLAPRVGEVGIGRETTLRVGPLTLHKAVQALSGGLYLVTLTLDSAQPLGGLTLTDPLPAGTRLLEGQNVLTLDLPAGQTTLRYRFGPDPAAGGPPCGGACATTDPTVTWRLP